jgi:hypothetical protein
MNLFFSHRASVNQAVICFSTVIAIIGGKEERERYIIKQLRGESFFTRANITVKFGKLYVPATQIYYGRKLLFYIIVMSNFMLLKIKDMNRFFSRLRHFVVKIDFNTCNE